MAPITSRSVGTFALRCVLDSCNRVRVFQYLNDEVSDELTDPPPPYCTDLQSRGPVLQEVARLSVAASELTLLGRLAKDSDERDAAYRGAAIHLRVAAEVLLGAHVLKLGVRKRRKLDLDELIEKIRTGQGGAMLRDGKRSAAVRCAEYVQELGNTSAHSLRRKRSREIPPSRGNVLIAIVRFEELVNATRLRRRGAS
jgi:hypothetical protein